MNDPEYWRCLETDGENVIDPETGIPLAPLSKNPPLEADSDG